jgi:hypothetical protein
MPILAAGHEPTAAEMRAEVTRAAIEQERLIDALTSWLVPGRESLGLNRVHALVRAGKSEKAASLHRDLAGATRDQALVAIRSWETSGFASATLQLLTERLGDDDKQLSPPADKKGAGAPEADSASV